MRVAFVGKGGSGKTTLASLFTRHLAEDGHPVLAMDADINQHLAVALGMDEDAAAALPAMGAHLEEIKDYLRGENPRISSAAVMTKTTPPGRGSRLVRVTEDNPISARFAHRIGGARLVVTGPFAEDDLGVACYHSKVGAVELLLNHLVDTAGEYVVVDMTAGADSFASGLFTRFDLTVLVAEPTRRGVAVYQQYKQYSADYDVRLAVVGNKVQGEEDVAFLRHHVGEDLLTWVGHSDFVRALEKGQAPPFTLLDSTTRHALEQIRQTVDQCEKDWEHFHRQTVEFHLRNAEAWGNDRLGTDLAAQVDPAFVPGSGLPDPVSIR